MVFDTVVSRRFHGVRPAQNRVDESSRREASAIGDLLAGFVERLGPEPTQYGTVAEVLPEVLPLGLRERCRVAAVSGGCVKLVAEGSSYVYELQLCKADLLEELQRLCPAAHLRRIEVRMAR